jgi:hypothetical protein
MFPPSRAAWLAALIGLVVVAAGCGPPEDPDAATADRVLAAVGQVPVSLPSSEDGSPIDPVCVRRVIVDEYGFEDEIVECPDGSGGFTVGPVPTGDASALSPDDPLDVDRVVAAGGVLPMWMLDRLIEELPPSPPTGPPAGPDVGDGLAELAASAAVLDDRCGRDLDAWAAELDVVAERAEALRSSLDGSAGPVDGGLIGSTHARAVGRALFERLVLETGCAAPGATALAYDEAADRGLLERTSRAALAVAELDRTLSGALSSRLFHFFSSLPNYEWLRTQREPIDLVVVGTSQAGAAIEVSVLADGLGVAAGNAFLPGSLAEVQRHWVPEVLRYVDPGRVVWLVGAIDLLIDCDDKGREAQFVERLANRRAVFARSGWFRTIDEIEVILGPAGEVNRNRGNAFKEPAPDPEALEAQRADYGDAFAKPGFCGDRAEVMAGVVASLEAEGREVVVVGVPTNPRMAELQPEVEAMTGQALGRLMGDHLDRTSATLVDLSSSLPDPELWADLTHPTSAGAERFTAELVEALR